MPDGGGTAGPVVTAVCTSPVCEGWYWRGPEDHANRVVGEHEARHGIRVRDGEPTPVTVIADIPGESERDRAGRIVREVWVQDARERGDSRASHLTPWSELDPVNRSVDERIGLVLGADALAREAEAVREEPQVAYLARLHETGQETLLAVFADQDEAAAWLTGWHRLNDHPGVNWETSAFPVQFVPRGGRQPDPDDLDAERTALELSERLDAARRDAEAQ
jgi:hypothetical protein